MKEKVVFLAVAALAVAGWSFAQLPGGYSDAPTDADYRMTILEPTEGATINGTEIVIEMSKPWVTKGTQSSVSKQRDILTPLFQVWVDGKDFGDLPTGSTAFTARNIPYGQHKIVVLAKNRAGDVVDRKEINVTTQAVGATTEMATTQPAAPQPAVAAAPPAPPAPEPAAPAPSAPAPSTPKTLPQTGSSAPTAAVAGLGLLALGLALRHRT